MTPEAFLNLVLQLWGKFAGAIQTGAAWEIWAQIEIMKKVFKTYHVMGREVKYPNSKKSVDLAFQIDGETYLIELKVESATNAMDFAGESLLWAMKNDVEKLRGFHMPGAKKWVVCIAYSQTARAKMREMATHRLFLAIDEESTYTAGLFDVDHD